MLIFKGNNFNGLCFSKTLIKEEKAVVALTNESKNPEFVKLAIDASLVSHTSITAAAECSKSFYKFLRKWIHPIHSLSEWTKETPEISIKENKVTSNYFWLWNYKMKIHEVNTKFLNFVLCTGTQAKMSQLLQ
ncbi:4468_t:CDS:2 [Entrophospora sp. SA101]|nr:4468_t:CDS:2 [Entrophospora sp. SA101]